MTFELLLRWLNGLGLPLLAIGVGVSYRAMKERADNLASSVGDIKTANAGVVAAMDKRAETIDDNIESIRRYQNMYLGIADDARSDADKAREASKRWRAEELEAERCRARAAEEQLQQLQARFDALFTKHTKLFLAASTQIAELKRQNRDYEVQLGRSGPTIRGLA